MDRFWRELSTAIRPASASRLQDHGISGHVLSGRRWTRTSRGVYRPTELTGITSTQRILDVAERLPRDAVFAGWAAAFLQGVGRLDGLDDHTMRPIAVPVILPPGLHRGRIDGVRYVQQGSSADRRPRLDVRESADLHCTGPVRTAIDLARWAPDTAEAVVSLDAVLQARLTSRDMLLAGVDHFRGSRGMQQARRALVLTTTGVRSSWESRLRMFWILDLGLTPPLVNRAVFDRGGMFLGVPDLFDEEAGLVVEYDGASWRSDRAPAGHRDVDQHRADNVREELLERAGLIVVRVDKVDLTSMRDRLRRRLLSARADGLRRDRARDRWTLAEPVGWYGLPA